MWSLLLGSTLGVQVPPWDLVPLNQFPFLMTHDSATGYLKDGNPEYWWAKTQTVGLGGQAACGARAFDVRPLVQDDGNLVMHHGPITVPQTITAALSELVTFANQNPNELILVYVSHCAGPNCMQRTQDAVRGMGVPTCTDGAQLFNATYGSVKTMGRLPPGGAMLVIFGFVEENYDRSIKCYGGGVEWAVNATVGVNRSNRAVGAAEADWPYSCYGKDASKAFEPLWTYLRGLSAQPPAASGELRMLQAHWQYDADSIAAGVLHASSILDDVSRADLNAKIAEAVLCAPCPPTGGVFKYNNLIEVDNVCNASPQLFNAFRSRVPHTEPHLRSHAPGRRRHAIVRRT